MIWIRLGLRKFFWATETLPRPCPLRIVGGPKPDRSTDRVGLNLLRSNPYITHLRLVVHGDLDEHHGVGRVAGLKVITDGFIDHGLELKVYRDISNRCSRNHRDHGVGWVAGLKVLLTDGFIDHMLELL